MYSKMAEEEDNKMADHWQKDADGILIFVSPMCGSVSLSASTREITDRFILCGCRCLGFGVD
jgi:hypothetical protein